MKTRLILMTCGVLAASSPAFAQAISGPYINLGAGVTDFQNQGVRALNVPDAGIYGARPGALKYSVDVGGTGGIGWGFGNGFRAELSGDYFRNTIRQFNGVRGSGRSDLYGGFGNALYDFNSTPAAQYGIVPYLGVGAGYQRQTLHNAGSAGTTLHGGRDGIAFDGIAGLAYNIPAVPGLALTAEYRFVVSPNQHRFHGETAAFDGGEDRVSARLNGLYTHTALLGVRYALWQPAPVVTAAAATIETAPPPPAPPPVVAEARTYLVFFDWDRSDLTARARAIVAQAAAASTATKTTRIEVGGYTDLSGSAAYNQKLSVRRAETVRAELVRDGIESAAISIQGHGESNPLVPTANGVREPQNRRVEIILK